MMPARLRVAKATLDSSASGEFTLRTADKSPRINNSQLRDRAVGDFFTDLTLKVFDGVQAQYQSGVACYDATLRALRANAEIKGRNDADPVVLKEDQLENYLTAGDAFEEVPTGVYVIWRYQSRGPRGDDGRQRHQLTLVGKRQDTLRWFLANATHSCFVLDIGVIDAIRRVNGAEEHRWATNRVDSAVKLPQRLLDELAQDSIEDPVLAKELRRFRHASFSTNFLFEGTVASFGIHSYLSRPTHRLLRTVAERLNGQLFVPAR